MRPLANGEGSFWQIVKNFHHAIQYLDVTIRMNIDKQNFDHADEMLKILANEGFSGKLKVYVGQIVGVNDAILSPSATYKPHHCFTNKEFAQAELQFKALAKEYGFSTASLARPIGTPCTAV
jgi:uncharacterized protein